MKFIKKYMVALAVLTAGATTAQNVPTKGVDFNRKDCNGTPHHLFADLDAGNAVILEFFMLNCKACISGAQKISDLKNKIEAKYPGKLKSYAIAFDNTSSCADIGTWVKQYAPTAYPVDSGETQVAYYGGMGMPTIVVLAGTSHSILGKPYIGLTDEDTASIHKNIDLFFKGLSAPHTNLVTALSVYPNPASTEITVAFQMKEPSNISMELFDIAGKKITTFLPEGYVSGNITKQFNISNLPNGNYLLKINAKDGVINRKLNIIR